LLVMLVLMSVGLFKLNMHLGKPHRFYRGFYNLRLSPVSREIAGVSLFFAGLMGFALFAISARLFDHALPGIMQEISAVIGLLGIGIGGFFMYKLYRIPARPFWDHWHTAASFAGTALSLGSLLLALVALASNQLSVEMGRLLAMMAGVGLALEGIGLLFHAKDLQAQESEGAASYYEQTTTYGYPYWLRNGLLAFALALSLGMALLGSASVWVFSLLALLALSVSIIGRSLFYVLVIPTTMPGAFFWKNKGFVEHAREVGLAGMPQLGVAYERHHSFKVGELLETIRMTSLQEKIAQVRRIVTG
jgi:DMSO reductase anchor subunit